MAPIPSSLDSETTDLIDNLCRRQRDLSEFQIPRLHDCKGPSLAVQQRLAAEVREDLDTFGKLVDVLEIRAEDVLRKTDRLAVLQLVEEFRESSARIRKDMRAALLHSKKVIDMRARANREELFAGAAAVTDSRNVEEKATDDALMKANNDVTEALRRTIGLMQTELERSVLSHDILKESTNTLRRTSRQHDILSSATHTSKQLITALERADWLDRLLVLAALTFFFLVVLFILKQRVLDRGVRLAFWWTRFLPGIGGDGGRGVRVVEKAESLERGGVVALKSGTTVLKEAASTVLVQTSSIVADSASSVPNVVADASAFSTSSAESPATVFLSSLTTTDTTTTTTLASPETLSVIQHSEL